jgi:uncharacterized pyridoxal phosphate-containing UPF0001 family protein
VSAAAAIHENLASIRERIDAACRRSGRDPAGVRLVGASKLQPIEALADAYSAGLRRFGENRVQEAGAKAPQLPADIEWHLFGPLQSNTAKTALPLFSLFHAIDRERSRARSTTRRGGAHARGLIEVNVGGEESKTAFRSTGSRADRAAAVSSVEIVG